MKQIKIIFFIGFALMSLTNLAQKKQLPPIIDRELFFGDPEITGAQLSPDGKFISFIKTYKGTRNIWVKKTNEDFKKAKPVSADTLRPISNYFWSRNGKYILYSQDKGGDENFNLYAIDPNEALKKGQDVPTSKDLTNLKGVRVYIYELPLNDPDIIYIGLNDRDKAWHDLYKLKISTGEKTLIYKNLETDRITGWIFDWDGNLRLATRSNQDGSNDILRVEKNGFEKIYSTNSFESSDPYIFDKDNKKIYIVTNKGDDINFSQLILLDPITKKEEFVEKDPLNKVDLNSLNFSEKTKSIISTIYNDSRRRIYWKDKRFENDYKMIQKSFPNDDISFFSSNFDENLWLFNVSSDINPGSVYLFDRTTKKTTFQYSPRPKIPIKNLAKMNSISYKSSDGMEIPAFLVLPKGVDKKNLPLIVVPHGGPWSRIYWGYGGLPQFLANRGYAVLLPNFRGSSGYGKKFIDAGNNEWGQKMQDDITWGVKYLVNQGIADPKRVGIMGGSYGGYATLAGVTFTPDTYAAAVSIVGPSNLNTLLNSIPPYWESIRKVFYLRMGDPTTPEGKEQLVRQSPLTHANKIKTPLMVVQGANDPRVNKAESDQIVVALRDRGFPVSYILAPDEGHGFARPVNNMAMYAEAEKFLAKHLNGRYQASMTPEVEKRLKEITVDVSTVTLK
ncbi:dipeptidyl aminopeptidase/acylaminoacyl-peptidase [Flavobacterium enshiense DK69]|uniref:Peptidase S9 n=1 Tax=Flavobacterium enshiense DK69 TaxID=1107311 RepID=V6SL52_9FLAO|nr:S9 family peptidase [Flavobacterium enshiense]ESU25130.1 dipeptidyl aminopeptidase/acylaminoacyl-peptidase [Flavobacterium enshiense DK69]KGO96973.1 peptidase S9 [Flavobacterium enshiense DK69]